MAKKKKKIREFVHSLYAHNIDSSFFPISLCSNIIVDGQVRRILFSLRACLRFLISPSMSGRRKPPRCCRAPRNREPSERALCRVMLLAFFYPAPHIHVVRAVAHPRSNNGGFQPSRIPLLPMALKPIPPLAIFKQTNRLSRFLCH